LKGAIMPREIIPKKILNAVLPYWGILVLFNVLFFGIAFFWSLKI
jgi:uncharacterized protein involved in exopolysaccharide biosynthesis